MYNISCIPESLLVASEGDVMLQALHVGLGQYDGIARETISLRLQAELHNGWWVPFLSHSTDCGHTFCKLLYFLQLSLMGHNPLWICRDRLSMFDHAPNPQYGQLPKGHVSKLILCLQDEVMSGIQHITTKLLRTHRSGCCLHILQTTVWYIWFHVDLCHFRYHHKNHSQTIVDTGVNVLFSKQNEALTEPKASRETLAETVHCVALLCCALLCIMYVVSWVCYPRAHHSCKLISIEPQWFVWSC